MVLRFSLCVVLTAYLLACGESTEAPPADDVADVSAVTEPDEVQTDAASPLEDSEDSDDSGPLPVPLDALDDASSAPAEPPETEGAPALSLGPSRCDLPVALGGPRARASFTPVVTFHELMYHPASGQGEWLELHNALSVDVDMSEWRLEGGVRYQFEAGTILPGDGRLIVASDPATLAPSLAGGVVLGPFEGKLDNGGERLELLNNAGRVMDAVAYEDRRPWPTLCDGSGTSLAKRARHLPSWEAESWESSPEVGGSPGEPNGPDLSAPPATLALLGSESSWRLELSGQPPGADWFEPGYDDALWEAIEGPLSLGGSPDKLLTVMATADNHLAVYLGDKEGAGLRLLGRDAEGGWDSAESFSEVATPADHLYLAAWEGVGDAGSPQMVIAEVLGSEGALLGTQAADFEALLGPPNATPGASLSADPPSVEALVLQIASAEGEGAWSTPQVERIKSEAPWGTTVGSSFGPSARFLWLDTFESNSMTNQLETYALFRSLEPILPKPPPISLGDAPLVTYARAEFTLDAAGEVASLVLEGFVDSGAVVYLNGVEVARVAMPEGPVASDTPASASGPHALEALALPVELLVDGDNLLAVSVHQSGADDSVFSLDLALNATLMMPTAPPPPALRLDEVSAGGASGVWLEILNLSSAPLMLAGYAFGVVDEPFHSLGDASLDPGERLLLRGDDLGLSFEPGDLVVLWDPEGRPIDGIHVAEVVQARDAWGRWAYPAEGTPEAPNVFPPLASVVINELLYHAPPIDTEDGQSVRDPREWIELHNHGAVPVNLSDWQLSEGIVYAFEADTLLPSGGYLVVSRDGLRPPGTPEEVAVFGPWSGGLSNSGDALSLIDGCGNLVDRVTYRDDGRWPTRADGGGSTLERRLAASASDAPETWGASEEAQGVSWQEVSYRDLVSPSVVGPDGQWRELVVGLLSEGEVLIDDLSVVSDPDGAATQLIQDPGFEDPDATSWRWLGTHRHSGLVSDPEDPNETVLRLVSTGSAGHMHNHLETTFAAGMSVQNGVEVEISYRARWVSGSNQLNTRLYFNRLARTTALDLPEHVGTPGAENTLAVEALGPSLTGLRHHPVVPGPGDPVTVSVHAEDPDGVASVTLWVSVDAEPFVSHDMTPDAAGDYRVELPPLALDQVVQMVVIAEDGGGTDTIFPPTGEVSAALYRVSEPLSEAHGKRGIRVWMTQDNADWLHAETNLMSNDLLPATVIYDEREIFYDVGVRNKGSQRGRGVAHRHGYALYFSPERPLLGGYRSAMIDRSEGVNFGQREWLLNQAMARAGSVSAEYNDLVELVAIDPVHSGPAEMQLARFGKVMLDRQFPKGGDGPLFEYELIYYPTTTLDGDPESLKRPRPDQVLGAELGSLGATREDHRHIFLAKNKRRLDDYQGLMQALSVFDLPDAEFIAEVESALDVDQWLRAFAFAGLAGVTDQYASGAHHNAQLYLRPSDGRLLYFPHDLDFFFQAPTTPLVKQPMLTRLLSHPPYTRAFCAHVVDIAQTSYHPDYLAHWAEQAASRLPEQPISGHVDFMIARSEHVLYNAADAVTKRVPPVDFTLTTNDGMPLEVSEETLLVQGLGWVDVHDITLGDAQGETPLSLTWLDATSWQAEITLAPGVNALNFVARDRRGQPLGEAALEVTYLSVTP